MAPPSPKNAARRPRNVKLGDARAENASNRSPGRREVLAILEMDILWKFLVGSGFEENTYINTALFFSQFVSFYVVFVVKNCETNSENCLSCFKSWLVEYLGNDITTKQSGEKVQRLKQRNL